MISTSFEYTRADSVEDALQALNEDTKLLAGGHSLIPALKLRLNRVDTLIDISQIKSLQDISMQGNELVIGAAATHASIANSQEVKTHAPLFAEVGGQIGDVQVRNAGTIGGSVAHADPAADWPAALLAADAKIVVQGSGGTRTLDAKDFFTGIFTTALEEGEIITQIRVDSMQGKKATYQKFAQPASRFALVGCAVVTGIEGGNLTGVRVAYTGVSDTPYCDSGAQGALEGKILNRETIDGAVAALDQSVYVMSDHYAGEAYRKHLAGEMLRRALQSVA